MKNDMTILLVRLDVLTALGKRLSIQAEVEDHFFGRGRHPAEVRVGRQDSRIIDNNLGLAAGPGVCCRLSVQLNSIGLCCFRSIRAPLSVFPAGMLERRGKVQVPSLSLIVSEFFFD